MTREEKYMEHALTLARECLINGDVPVGAVVVYNDKIIGEGKNSIEKTGNSLAHAEIIAINNAIENLGYKHLLNCELYVTLEPCSMCAGAIVLARIPKLIIGTMDTKTGACGSILNITSNEKLNHQCEIVSGILQNDCSIILKDFFKKLRNKYE